MDYLEVIREDNFIIEVTKDEIVITGSEFAFPADGREVNLAKNLTIRANQLTLTNDIIAPSGRITISCQSLIVTKEKVTINVSGKSGDEFTIAAADGTLPGEHGSFGSTGNSGNSAGKISIRISEFQGFPINLIANGGNGAEGQAGGHGQDGLIGTPGGLLTGYRDIGDHYGNPGGVGQNGGNSGKGGNGGNGGDGGVVEFLSINKIDFSNFQFSIEAGVPGEPGRNGKVGKGGDGGDGGLGLSCRYSRSIIATTDASNLIDTICNNSESLRGAKGRSGDNGLEISKDNLPEYGMTGTIGSDSVGIIDYKMLSEKFSLLSFKMLLSNCEAQYLIGKVKIYDFIFLYMILSNVEKISTNGEDPTLPKEPDANAKAEISSLLNKISTLIIQVSQGVDFFGFTKNQVTLIESELYQKFIQDLFLIGARLEKTYEKYSANSFSQTLKQQEFEGLLDELQSKIKSLENQRLNFSSEVVDLRKRIDELIKEQISLTGQLEYSKERFKKAVERKASCNFKEVLAASSTLVSFAVGVGNIIGGFAALDNIATVVNEKKIKNTLEGRAKYIVGELKVVKGGIDEVKNGYSQISNLLKEKRDYAKLAVSREDFSSIMEKFKDIEEANEYKKLIEEYLAVIEIRNKHVLDHDILVSRIHDIEAEIQLTSSEIANIRTISVENRNIRLPEHLIFFERAIERVKYNIAKIISMEEKSLQHWSLEVNPEKIEISKKSIAHLEAAHSRILASYLDTIIKRNGAPQLVNGPTEIVFYKDDNPTSFHSFVNSKHFTFEIAPSLRQYNNISRFLVKEMKLRLKGLMNKGTRIYNCLLTHHGNPNIVDADGKIHSFRHMPRTLFGFFKNSDECIYSLGGYSGKYLDLSPFATWSIKINSADNKDEIELNDVTEIGVTLIGIAHYR